MANFVVVVDEDVGKLSWGARRVCKRRQRSHGALG